MALERSDSPDSAVPPLEVQKLLPPVGFFSIYDVALSTSQRPALEADQLRERIDAALNRFAQFGDDCPMQLAEAIRYALLGPGKRLRPQLVLMAAEACGGSVEAAMPAACAVEMVHAYSLVHDDLPAMDDDDLRRGRPTCHKQFGEAMAILVGDALLARAFETLAAEIRPQELAARCCFLLARAAGPSALVGGQVDDLATGAAPQSASNGGLRELESIHRRKTGALIEASLALGATVAEGTEAQLSALSAYGRNVGLAFQITDDLLDVAGSQESVGKRLAKDAKRGKLTFPQVLGVEQSRLYAQKLVEEACAMIEVFGARGGPLHELANLVLTRKK
jgi:geranylgeranyl diphosphate synthase, type II